MSLEYIRKYYKVPAKRLGRVRWTRRDGTALEGTITGATQYLLVRFDDRNFSVPIHPTEEGLVYL